MTELVDGAIIQIDQIGRLEVRAIYERFLALPQEKQDRIRNAAFREFGRYGYKKTSTEQIAKAAGIAKGMVFHYFGSKLGLYEYLFDFGAIFLEEKFVGLFEKIQSFDFIEQYRFMVKTKFNCFNENPYIFEFFTMLFTHGENQMISEKSMKRYQEAMDMRNKAFALVYANDNTERFRDDIDPVKAKKYISWMIEGYTQYMVNEVGAAPLADVDTSDYWTEFDEVLDDLKKVFYKPEQE